MKKQHIQFRCSIYEKKMLKLKAKRAGLSLSEYCRGSALGHSIIERLTPEQLKYYSILVEYKNNFKRISNIFKKRDPRLTKEVVELANEIRNHLHNFNR
nr:mobilization protein MbpA [uncultured Allomuricauda sp.]